MYVDESRRDGQAGAIDATAIGWSTYLAYFRDAIAAHQYASTRRGRAGAIHQRTVLEQNRVHDFEFIEAASELAV